MKTPSPERNKQKPETVTIVTPSFHSGGAERVALNLADEMTRIGIKVNLIAIRSHGPLRNQVNANITLIELQCKRLRNAVFKINRIVGETAPDLVISVTRSTNIVVGLGLHRKNHILLFREATTLNNIFALTYFKRNLIKMTMRFTYTKADLVIGNSQRTAHDLVHHGIITHDQCKVIGNPVIPDQIEDLMSQYTNHPWLSDNRLSCMVTAGRLEPVKDHELLIRAFSEATETNPDLRLLILGEGPLARYLHDLTRQLSVEKKIEFAGYIENPYPYFKESDLFVLTSKWEGFGNVIVEAMITGTRILITECPGGPSEILKYGAYGKIVPTRNPEILAGQILEYLKKEDHGESRKYAAAEYTLEAITRKYLDASHAQFA